MDEEEFDSTLDSRPFETADATRAEAQFRRCLTLGAALWGKTSHDLQRQLLSPHPQIPSGFTLADFRKLLGNIQTISAASADPRFAWLPRSVLHSPTILVGNRHLTTWEARCEIVRRAIEYFETR